jgi:hypothetical protein
MRGSRVSPRWQQFITAVKAELDLLHLVVLYKSGPAAMKARDAFRTTFPWLVPEMGKHLTMWQFDMMRLDLCVQGAG